MRQKNHRNDKKDFLRKNILGQISQKSNIAKKGRNKGIDMLFLKSILKSFQEVWAGFGTMPGLNIHILGRIT